MAEGKQNTGCLILKRAFWIDPDLEIYKLEFVSKGVFFSESAMRFFQISKPPQKNYSKKTILSLKFKFPANNTLLL